MTWLEEERAERLQSRSELADFGQQLLAQMVATEMRLTAQLADMKRDLIKWSFVFCFGALAAVAALAGVLR